jgi:hypothetical protein
MIQKIIILCFETSEVLIYNYDSNIWEDVEDFLTSEEIDISPNNCQWMVVNELNIQIK